MNRDEARKKIIFALDVNGVAEIDRYAGMLSGKVGMFKVGKELFTSCGPEAVRAVQRHGGQVFLDLKYHDIPNTVAKAMLEAARLGVQLTNLHALGGAEMMETAATCRAQGVRRRSTAPAGGDDPDFIDGRDPARCGYRSSG